MSPTETSHPENVNEQPTGSDAAPGFAEEWSAETAERAYYRRDQIFIKRTLRRTEYITTQEGTKHIPRFDKARLQNEAASLRLIHRLSNIPVPAVYGAFEVDGAYCLIMEYIDGVSMRELSDDHKKVVCAEIDRHRSTLQGIKSDKLGGPTGIAIPPFRLWRHIARDPWPLESSEGCEYVFCHNDLTHSNVIVDPDTLKIKAIIDWEYAGFYPSYFEGHFYERVGSRPTPSVAMEGEHDDVPKLLDFWNSQLIE